MKTKLRIAIMDTEQSNEKKILVAAITEYGNAIRSSHSATLDDSGRIAKMTKGVPQDLSKESIKTGNHRKASPQTNYVLVEDFFKIFASSVSSYFQHGGYLEDNTLHAPSNLSWKSLVEVAVGSILVEKKKNGLSPEPLKSDSLVFDSSELREVWDGQFGKWAPYEFSGEEIGSSDAPDGEAVVHCTDAPNVVIRPNGEPYYPRSIMGHIDVALLRKFRATQQYAQLVGPPGVGKTALAEAAFGEDLITVHGHNEFMVSHFVGSYIPNRAKSAKSNEPDWIWVDGPLTRAMKEGRPLLIDEATRIPSGSLDIVISATDGRNTITLDDLPDAPQIIAKEGFYVIMSYNPDTLNGRQLDEAIRSRFGIIIHVDTDFESLRKLEIPSLAMKVAKRMQNRSNKVVESGGRPLWVPQMRELLFYKKIVDEKLGENFAWNNLYAQCPEPYRAILSEELHQVASELPVLPKLEAIL